MTWTPVEVGSGQTTRPSSTSTGRAVRHGDTPLPSPCLASFYPALEVESLLFYPLLERAQCVGVKWELPAPYSIK